jgi:hypothetical protein
MAIPEAVVEAVVTEVSSRLSDPNYAQVAVGTFVERHPDAARFVSARMDDAGGGEGVIHTVFHAQVLSECFDRHLGRLAPSVGFAELDAAAVPDPFTTLSELQPALASYLVSNVEEEAQRKLVGHLGLALHHAAGGA